MSNGEKQPKLRKITGLVFITDGAERGESAHDAFNVLSTGLHVVPQTDRDVVVSHLTSQDLWTGTSRDQVGRERMSKHVRSHLDTRASTRPSHTDVDRVRS